jgi:hypothetical protein
MRAKVYPLLKVSSAKAEMPEGNTGKSRHHRGVNVRFRPFQHAARLCGAREIDARHGQFSDLDLNRDR